MSYLDSLTNMKNSGYPDLFGNTMPTSYQNMAYGSPTSMDFLEAPSLPNAGVMSNFGAVDGIKAPGLFDNFFNKTQNGITTQGWGGMALGAASGLMNGYLGMQQLGVAKDTLAQNKKQFDMNFNAQAKTLNSHMEDRQNARLSANPGGYTSTAEYMKKYGI